MKQVPREKIKFYKQDGFKYMIDQFSISYCYSATLLKEMKQTKTKSESGKSKLLAFDIEEFKNDAPSLAKSLGFLIFNNPFINCLKENSNQETLAQVGNKHQFLHFFTHGFLDNKEPNNSYLVLRHSPNQHDNLLHLHEIYNIPLNAQMVVTSACEAGIGNLYKGEGIISLARGFSFAGAESVITTLWKIDSKPAQELTNSFYKYLQLGFKKDEAIQKAKTDFIYNPNHNDHNVRPFQWAGFIPVGNMEAVTIPTMLSTKLMSLALLLGIFAWLFWYSDLKNGNQSKTKTLHGLFNCCLS